MTALIGAIRGQADHPELPCTFTYAWLEGQMKAELASLAEVDDWQDRTRWPAGRLFGEIGEYRWITGSDGLLHQVLLLDGVSLPEPFRATSTTLELVAEHALILWGDWVDPEMDRNGNPDALSLFYAPEIPRILSYPLDPQDVQGGSRAIPKKTPRLIVRRYRATGYPPEGPSGEFIRCTRFEMMGKEDLCDATD